jgi:SAM-dependent methyltransferase
LETSRFILEAGAGVGVLLPEIQGAAPEAVVVGVDVAEGMISLAPPRFPRAVMDATGLAFQTATFDVCVLAFVLFHIPEPAAALGELHRVLGVGGTLATITWGRDPTYGALDVWNDELEARGASPTLTLSRHDLVNTPDKVAALMSSAGFGSIHTWIGIYDRQMTVDGFLRHRMGHGQSRARFESLEPEDRPGCLAAVRRRLAGIDPAELRDRAEVIYALATR